MADPASTSVPPAARAARRVAVGFFACGFLALLDLPISAVAAYKSGGIIPIAFPLGFLVLWGIGVLFWRGYHFLWAPLAYLSASSLGATGGALLAAVLSLPWRLVLALMRHTNIWIGLHALLLAGVACLVAWFLFESSRVVAAGAPAARSPWAEPRAFAAYAALPAVAFVGLALALLQGPWTKPARDEARRIYGDTCDYFVLSFQNRYQHGAMHGQVIVLLYNEDTLEQVTLDLPP